MNDTIRKNIKRALSVLLLFALIFAMEKLTVYLVAPSTQSYVAVLNDRKAVEGRITAVMVGASLMKDAAIPAVLDNWTGELFFNAATPNQTMEMSRYVLEDFAQSNPLRLCLIDLSVNRAVREESEERYIAKYIVYCYMLNASARRAFLRDMFTLDELPQLFSETARYQLRYFTRDLGKRFGYPYFSYYLTHGYVPDPTVKEGYRGYAALGEANEQGKVLIPEERLAWDRSGEAAALNINRLSEIVRVCREQGIRPVLVSFPTTNAYLLHYKGEYDEIFSPFREYAEKEGIDFLDFNLSRFKVETLSDDTLFCDLKHLNADGSQLFSAYFGEVLRDLEAGADLSGYFYASYDETVARIEEAD